MHELRGRTAVVTGGAAGIGRAMAEAFIAEGMAVVIADIEEPVLDETAMALRARGGTVVAVRCDVSEAEDVEALADRAYRELGGVHVVCNNAGVSTGGPLWMHTAADWKWVMGANLWGVVHGVHAFVPRMIAGGEEGHVVNTASVAGLLTPPFMGIYNVTKHAVVALTETLYKDLSMAGTALKASVLCPGFVRTGIAESGRNRPGGAHVAPELEGSPMFEMAKAAVAGGIDPVLVGAAVVDAIKHEKFYILTHPEVLPAFKQRADDVLKGRNPSTTFEVA